MKNQPKEPNGLALIVAFFIVYIIIMIIHFADK